MLPSQLLKDGVHPNAGGYSILAQMIERHLRFNPLFSDPWETKIRTYEAKRPIAEGVNDEITLSGPGWTLDNEGVLGTSAEGKLRLEFQGNRVDVIAAHTNLQNVGTARILIDGKPPSEFPSAYTITRPSAGPGTWFPAIRRISHVTPLLVENWTLRIDHMNADATDFDFDVAGSKNGTGWQRIEQAALRIKVRPRRNRTAGLDVRGYYEDLQTNYSTAGWVHRSMERSSDIHRYVSRDRHVRRCKGLSDYARTGNLERSSYP